MISKKSIDQVKDLSIEQVIGKYISLKKKGANFEAPCPFHEEKTPSFTVSPSKGIYKCFGCGEGGNGHISFVMTREGYSFPEAITDIGQKFNIFIEKDDSDDAREYVKKQEVKDYLSDVNAFALDIFQKSFKDIKEDFNRVSPEMVELFSLGYSNDDFKYLYHKGLENKVSEKNLLEAGLITKKEKKVYDFFNKRTIFPIIDHLNKIVGFGGRDEAWTKGDKFPKYINTKDTILFQKKVALYGIHLAKKHIIKSGNAIIVEGYYDVIAMHEQNHENTVSSSGTAFTKDQAELLKKWCNHLSFMFDADAAGIKAAEKSILMVTPLGFTSDVLFFPDGEDPDSFDGDLDKYIEENQKDGIEWIAAKFFENAKSIHHIAAAESSLESLLSSISMVRIRNGYVKKLAKKYKLSRADIEKNIQRIHTEKAQDQEEKGHVQLPASVDREEYEKFGFYEVQEKGNRNTGYYFINQSGKPEQRSNFIIKPLFHIYSKIDNKRLIEIINARTSKIIDIPSEGFVGQTQFEAAIIKEGFFYFHGTKPNFQRVMVKILEKFPRCEEIKTLGWQDEGFYSFANGIVDGRFKKVDHYGIVEFDKNQYFLPAFSSVYKDVRREDDLYENERHFVYRKGDVSFEEWSNQFIRVFGNNGKMAIAFFICSLFRDYIFSMKKIFPHLFMFGDVSTGKSFCARSLNSIFHGGEPGFNLNTGTMVGMNRKLAQFRNALIWFDEYDNDLDKLRYDRIKASYDGLGHEKGIMSQDNRTKKTEVNSASIISGQYLPTRDANALFTRCILLSFEIKYEDRSTEDLAEATKLNAMEDAGLSDIIIEILSYRDLILKDFNKVNFEVQSEIKKRLKDEAYQGRIGLNFSLILTTFKILSDKLKLPFDYDDLFENSIKMIMSQSDQIHDSDALKTFWKMLEFLYATHQVQYNVDFKIETINDLNIRVARNKNEVQSFKQPKKCLFVRFTKIHPLYMAEHRKQNGENGIGDGSIKQYMKTNKAFVGFTPASSFDGSKSSAFVFDYNMLGIELETQQKKSSPGPPADNPDREDGPKIGELEFD